MVKSGVEETETEHKADKIYKFSRKGPEEYMEKCSMLKGQGKAQDYISEKKIEF